MESSLEVTLVIECPLQSTCIARLAQLQHAITLFREVPSRFIEAHPLTGMTKQPRVTTSRNDRR